MHFSWVFVSQTIFQTVGYKEKRFYSTFYGYNERKIRSFRPKEKQTVPKIGWDEAVTKGLREIKTSWEKVKWEALNRLK